MIDYANIGSFVCTGAGYVKPSFLFFSLTIKAGRYKMGSISLMSHQQFKY